MSQSEQSTKKISTRCHANPQFAEKNKKFLENIKNERNNEETSGQTTPGKQSSLKAVKKTSLMSIKGMDKDPYCWCCHLPEATVECGSCIRSFHPNCLPPGSIPEEADYICQDCSGCNEPWNIAEPFVKFGSFLLENVHKDVALVKYDSLFHISKEKYPDYFDKIINPMELKTVIKKNKNRSYSNSKALMSEVKWIYHNSYIYFGVNHAITLAAKKLVNMLKASILDIDNCPECFLRSKNGTQDWFTTPCNVPHPVVMAKVRGYSYWPSKVLSCEGNNVKCCFFGAYDKAVVSINQLLLLSKDTLSNFSAAKKNNKLLNALKEMKLYVHNYEKVYGPMKYFRPTTRPTKSDIKTLLEPLPQLTGSSPTLQAPEFVDDSSEQSSIEEDKEISRGRKRSTSRSQSPPSKRRNSILKLEAMRRMNDLVISIPKVETKLNFCEQINALLSSEEEEENSLDRFEVKEFKEDIENFVQEDTDLEEQFIKLKKMVREKQQELKKENQGSQILINDIQVRNGKILNDLRKDHIVKKSTDLALTKLNYEERLQNNAKEIRKFRWCSHCLTNRANYLCCWSTYYCSIECQKSHWRKHFGFCMQMTQMLTTSIVPQIGTPLAPAPKILLPKANVNTSVPINNPAPLQPASTKPYVRILPSTTTITTTTAK